jgi:tRNA nucleotidyltransferase (CCA-adding enzyme)
VQFASRFECTLAPATVELCRTLSLDDLSIERLFEEFKKWLLKPGKPSLGLCAFLDIKLDEYFPEINPFDGSWDTLGAILDRMAELRDAGDNGEVGKECAAPLSDAQKMEFAFAALLAGNAGTSLKFLERITNETHLLKVVPLVLDALQNLDAHIVNDIPALRRLAVKLGGLKLLCLLVKCIPGKESFGADIWNVAGEYGLLEAAPQPFLTGKMLMDLGFKPGKEMGEIIKQSFELQLDGKIADAESAIAWAKQR